ncbi:hypothetical protein KC319_g2334 [Hortaea werneckii]|nr:hypothetical protein KC352_g7972 [Hortaea werneckii]KAI7570041.1 hypothetical protein KC317_g2808 [Hortaea werneckii]KAI7624038.1 hypothetical protein KC346_g2412 [Hortaea werneckii]KAI7680160.1 hypothetical protein KC319_g2334 [Hortaea werneckii]KAI7716202.1 hypothetical protein KC322_g2691 [Hortaea werneckii]
MLEPRLTLDGGIELVELAVREVDMNEEPIELLEDAMLEPRLRLDGGAEVEELVAEEVDMKEEPMGLVDVEPELDELPGEVG